MDIDTSHWDGEPSGFDYCDGELAAHLLLDIAREMTADGLGYRAWLDSQTGDFVISVRCTNSDGVLGEVALQVARGHVITRGHVIGGDGDILLSHLTKLLDLAIREWRGEFAAPPPGFE